MLEEPWELLQLSQSGLPVYHPGEVEIHRAEASVHRERHEIFSSVHVVITNYRLLLVHAAGSSVSGCAVPLSIVDAIVDCATLLHRWVRR